MRVLTANDAKLTNPQGQKVQSKNAVLTTAHSKKPRLLEGLTVRKVRGVGFLCCLPAPSSCALAELPAAPSESPEPGASDASEPWVRSGPSW